MTPRRRAAQSIAAIYRAPLVIALVSTLGLAAALFGDGIWDALSWLGLGVPVAVAAVYWRIGAKRAEPR